jgi:hypothetical protein
MGFFALALALGAMLAAVLPHPGIYLGMGLGILAFGLGLVGYRRHTARPAARLSGAAAMTLACFALLMSGLRYWAMLTAIERLEDLL